MERKGKGKDESQDWKHRQMPAEEKKSKENMIRVTCFDGNNFSGKDIRGESSQYRGGREEQRGQKKIEICK